MIFLVAFVTAAILARVLSALLYPGWLLDHPNDRSLHYRSVPHTGGFAIVTAIIISAWLSEINFCGLSPWSMLPISIGFSLLLMISLVDDFTGIGIRYRFLVHLTVALSLLGSGEFPDQIEISSFIFTPPVWLAGAFAWFFTVWMINLYNFMDGMDGFAGGMAVIGFSALAWLGWADPDFANLCLIVAAASAGFLVYNFPPAKIFMGDVGSTSLGFLVAACSLWGSRAGLFPLWIAILVFSPFIVDATITLLLRLLRGEKVWQAHRSHYYQRLVLLGWGHRKTVLAEYVLMLACAGSAMMAMQLPPVGQVWLIVIWVFIYGGLIWGVGRLERRRVTVSAP